MPMINGRFYSRFGQYSAYVSLLIQRMSMAEIRQQAESDSSTLATTLSGASDNLALGLGNLAARAAIKRIKAAPGSAQTISAGVNRVA